MPNGCHYITDHIAGRVFIPGCMGAAVYGPERCTCRSWQGVKVTDAELIQILKQENKELKNRLKRYEQQY